MPKIRLKPALIGAAAVVAWFFAVRHGAPVWVLQSILMVAVDRRDRCRCSCDEPQPEKQQRYRVAPLSTPS